MQCPQEHSKTMVYAKIEGQTKCIMWNAKVENLRDLISHLRETENEKPHYSDFDKSMKRTTAASTSLYVGDVTLKHDCAIAFGVSRSFHPVHVIQYT